jgi:molybdate transport system substrate-binding protein
MKKHLLSTGLVIGLALLGSLTARAQSEITLLAPGSIRQAFGELAPAFEKKTGQKVKVTFGSGPGTKQQAARGEVFDVMVLQPPYPEVIASGNVVTSSETPIATGTVGVVVRKGAPHPDISTPEAVKKLFLSVASIAYPDPASGAASGIAITDALKKAGIFDQVQAKSKLVGEPLALVAKREAEIGLAYMVDMSEPGIDIVGSLPRGFLTPTGFVGFVSAHAKDPAAAKALLDFLASPEAAPVYTAKGMVPGK